MADRVGQQLGNYRLARVLGRGGFAEVYLGEHVDLGTQVAIKVLHAQLTSRDMERFNAEASTIARLSHPHIVRLLEFATDEGTPFLVLDYAPGGTLRERHPRGTPLPLDTILPYVRQVCDALHYAHEQKLIHRDVKPENLLLSADGQVLLSDFGIATVAQNSHSQSTQEALGTITYMAPEQIQGKPRPASDLYALGVIVYEWLTGEPPFGGPFSEIATQHLFTPPTPLRERVPALSEAVEYVVSRALAKDPHERFPNARAFATALEEAAQGKAPLLFAATRATPPAPANASTPADWQQMTGPTAPELPQTFSLPGAAPAARAPFEQTTAPFTPKAPRRPVRNALLVALALLLLGTSGVALALNHPSFFGGPNASPISNFGSTAFADNSTPGHGSGSASTPGATPSAGSNRNGASTPGPTNAPTQKPTPPTTTSTPSGSASPTPTSTPTPSPTPSPTPTQQPTPTPTPPPPPPPTCCPGTAPAGSYSKWWVDTFGSAPGYYGAGGSWHRVGTLYGATNYVFCKAWGPEVSDSAGNYNHWWLWTDLDTGGQGWVSAYYLSRWGNDVAKDNSGTVIPTCRA